MNRLTKIASTVLAILATPSMAATINFDGGFPTGSTYAEQGAIFYQTGSPAGTFSAQIGPNGTMGLACCVETTPNFLSRDIFVSLNTVTDFVSVDLGHFAGQVHEFYLVAFGKGLQFLGSDFFRMEANEEGMRTLSFRAAGIESISFGDSRRFQGLDSSSYFADNVTWNTKVAGVPEPATWAMLVFGFGLIGREVRKKKPAHSVKMG
jgi:hypothetical protein